MNFSPNKDGEEAGVSLFQKDNNYVNYTIIRRDGKLVLQLVFADDGKEMEVFETRTLKDYDGKIILQLISKDHTYQYSYSLDKGQTFVPFASTGANLILCHGYTGAYLGVYATANGNMTNGYADFDWVHYKGHPRF
jgi:alpha-N-arabinofuranosidase